jgi:hypothetical protein
MAEALMFGNWPRRAGKFYRNAAPSQQKRQANRTTDKVNVTVGPEAAASNTSSEISSTNTLSSSTSSRAAKVSFIILKPSFRSLTPAMGKGATQVLCLSVHYTLECAPPNNRALEHWLAQCIVDITLPAAVEERQWS